jgi:hypothetical protein
MEFGKEGTDLDLIQRSHYVLASMRTALLLVVCVLMANMSPCRANFWDTIDQCIARYGDRQPPTGISDPGRTGAEAALFTKEGYNFEVYLLNGVVECEMITKTDRSLLSDKDKEKIIKMESTGSDWAKPIVAHGQNIWMRSDGAAISSYASDSPLMFVQSPSYIQLSLKNKKNFATFPTEAEVRRFVVPGTKEEDVFKKFGFPGIREPQDQDGELLIYCPLPSREKAIFAYAGFEVFVKNGKVTDLEIIHGDHTIAK